jgi:hypothetical protein
LFSALLLVIIIVIVIFSALQDYGKQDYGRQQSQKCYPPGTVPNCPELMPSGR